MTATAAEIAAFRADFRACSMAYKTLGYRFDIRFAQMTDHYGKVGVCKKLVVSSEFQSGFIRLARMRRLDLTIEALIIRHPTLFTRGEIEAARWRLSQVVATT